MKLVIEWVESTRPHLEKVRVEDEIQKTILDFFNGVENAEKAYNLRHIKRECLSNDWSRAMYEGFRSTKHLVTAGEYGRLAFKASFVER